MSDWIFGLETLPPWLQMVWRACWQATVLFAIVAVVMFVLRERIAPRWRFVLWGLVLLRLLIPVTPGTSLSVFNWVSPSVLRSANVEAEASDLVESSQVATAAGNGLYAETQRAQTSPKPAQTENVVVQPALESTAAHSPVVVTTVTSPERQSAPSHRAFPSFLPFLVGGWLIGVVLWILSVVASYRRLRKLIVQRRAIDDDEVLMHFQECCKTMSLRRVPKLSSVPQACSPFVTGVIRPHVFVPEALVGQLASDQWKDVFMHELAHVKRHDVLLQWLILSIRIVYWFHPVVWLTSRQLRLCREAACDDIALNKNLQRPSQAYGETLLHLAVKQTQPVGAGVCGMVAPNSRPRLFSSGNELFRRVHRLVEHRRESAWMLCVALVLVVIIACVGLTDVVAQTEVIDAVVDPREKDKSFIVEGSIYDFDTESGAKDTTVKLFAYRGLSNQNVEDYTLVAETKTDQEGKYRFDSLTMPYGNRYNRLQYVIASVAKGRTSGGMRTYVINARDNNSTGIRDANRNVKGVVVGPDGKPIEGAIVKKSILLPPALVGQQSYTTKEDGLFYLGNISGENAYLRVTHPDYPTHQVFKRKSGQYSKIQLKQGALIKGRIIDQKTGKPMANAMVSAEPWRYSSETLEALVKTDSEGHFQMRVMEGTYMVMLESEHRVMKAPKVDCRSGHTVELGELVAIEGGWIVGQVINKDTGKPVTNSIRKGEEKLPVSVGLYSEARPQAKVSKQWHFAEVDQKGWYRMRALPGENYPFAHRLMNTTRTVFNTDRFDPVVVEAGKETRYDFVYTPKKTPAQLMAAAESTVDALPKDVGPRVSAIIDQFRKHKVSVDNCEQWCMLMREIVTIGKPAVPQLCEALESEKDNFTQRRLIFALRAIGDVRAVPSLIRAFPNALQPSSSDYGLIVKDPELLRFMQKHQVRPGRGGHFGLGRPIREIHEALRRLTGHGPKTSPLNWISRSKDLRAYAAQRKLYHDEAKKWAKWWEENWQAVGVEEAYAKVNLPEFISTDLSNYPSGLTITKNAELCGGTSQSILCPFGSNENGDYFVDLDVGDSLTWPKKFPKEDLSTEELRKVATWAKDKGADLFCQYSPTDQAGNGAYALSGIGMQLWEIDPFDAKNIKDFLQRGELPKRRKLTGRFLLHKNAATGELGPVKGSTFLYLTKEQGLGIITVTDFVTEKRDMTGAFLAPDPGVGQNRGVRFDYRAIAR